MTNGNQLVELRARVRDAEVEVARLRAALAELRHFVAGVGRHVWHLVQNGESGLDVGPRGARQRRVNTRERDSKAEMTSNEGFSVVAPMKVTSPFST